jgi:hypothetical protein
MKRDKQLCDECLLKFGSFVHSEIPLKYQQISLKSNISRFSLIVSESMSIDEIKKLDRDLDNCFKIQLNRICANQDTFIPTTQLIVNDELQSLANIVKPLHHLFIYTNVPRDMTNLNFIHCNIWLILDYPNSCLDCKLFSSNIVAISLSDIGSDIVFDDARVISDNTNPSSHPLSNCFTSVRRETLQQLSKRLQTDAFPFTSNIHTMKPLSSFFGFE